MLKTNIQITTPATINPSGDGMGGTTGILYVNSVTLGLELIMPDGTVKVGAADAGLGLKFV